MRARLSILAPAVVLIAASLTFAQAPDCTGVSPVLNSHPDLINELDTVRIASGLQFPVFVTSAPGDNERLFVLEKPGRIRVIKNCGVVATPFLDINPLVTGGTSENNERGLLGLAFHPDYQNNGYLYVYYTATSPSGALTVARYERMTDDLANPATATIIIQVSHPISNHNGGMIAFSPVDGHLYMGTGDGGSGCDPGAFPGNGQNKNSLLGKMLRLDVDGAFPYDTNGNPFDGGTPGADEVWYYGLRNPWRWTFDSLTGSQYIGDVGQNAREELDCGVGGVGGTNYGWNAYEGVLCDTCSEWAPACPIVLDDYVPPFRDFSLAGAPCSVIGGYVYRGCRMPDLNGVYFYSDYCDDFVNTLRTDGMCSVTPSPDVNRENDLEPGGAVTISKIASYGQDNQGELYIVDQGNGSNGEVFKIIPEMTIMEVSGPGATQLLFNADQEPTWEDLPGPGNGCFPTRFYKIYRADNVTVDGPDPFVCVHTQSTSSTVWAGGDLSTPLSGEAFYYLVTGQNASLDESTAGTASNGTLRIVDTASPCN